MDAFFFIFCHLNFFSLLLSYVCFCFFKLSDLRLQKSKKGFSWKMNAFVLIPCRCYFRFLNNFPIIFVPVYCPPGKKGREKKEYQFAAVRVPRAAGVLGPSGGSGGAAAPQKKKGREKRESHLLERPCR